MNGIIIDPATGHLSIPSPAVGTYVIAVKVENYGYGGSYKGSVISDFCLNVVNSADQAPISPVAGIQNFSGSAQVTGPTTVYACPSQSFCFDVVFDDPDPLDSVQITSNIDSVLPGATITSSIGNQPTATVCWTAVNGVCSFSTFAITADDGACPIPGTNSYTFAVQVGCQTTASESSTGSAVHLWPNPLSESSHVDVERGSALLFIYDQSGRLLRKLECAGSTILHPNLSAGSYFVLTSTQHGHLARHHLIVQ